MNKFQYYLKLLPFIIFKIDMIFVFENKIRWVYFDKQWFARSVYAPTMNPCIYTYPIASNFLNQFDYSCFLRSDRQIERITLVKQMLHYDFKNLIHTGIPKIMTKKQFLKRYK